MSENLIGWPATSAASASRTADAIAMKLGIDKTAMIRVRAGISSEAMDEGHCGLPTPELVSLAQKLLEVSQDLIRGALGLELADGAGVADRVGETDCLYCAERRIKPKRNSLRSLDFFASCDTMRLKYHRNSHQNNNGNHQN
jgi:exodeoxyribonuclease V alpha subunit